MARWTDPIQTDAYYNACRPAVFGTRGVVSSGHHLASLAGMEMLQRGGNAIDAGVAAGLCLNVVQPDATSLGGVAPIMVHQGSTGEVATLDGLGTWPQRSSIEFFERQCAGELPPGILRSVVPAAADAWITALEIYGTMRFAEVAAPALELAERGFQAYRYLYRGLLESLSDLRRWPSTAAVLLPSGNPPPIGTTIVQKDLAMTLRRMIDAENRVTSGGRTLGLAAARGEFYEGETAKRIVSFAEQEGGLLTDGDLRGFRTRLEAPCRASYRGYEVVTCGPWCQGPVLLQALNILEGFDLSALEHNSGEYLHLMLESLKLAFADREAYYGDPKFVSVPMEGLLSKEYANERRELIDRQRAFPDLPPAGDPYQLQGQALGGRFEASHRTTSPRQREQDTSFVCVADRWGNSFAATPSDGAASSPFVPGVGCLISSRGSQSWLERDHPSALAPGKRPRLTPSPAMIFSLGKLFMVLGTPGGDLQPQAMLQVVMNVVDYGMEVQTALEVDRAYTYTAPDSFWPHQRHPGLVRLDPMLPAAATADLSACGHRVERLSPWGRHQQSSVCAVQVRSDPYCIVGAADSRRESCAMGW
jgi:gamma-glutamyltranspeptidase/glutathione hydrolase